MAADGQVLIDTKMDTKAIEAGTDDIVAAARRMAKKVGELSDSVRASFSRQADTLQKSARMYNQQLQKVEELKEKLEELRKQKIPTEAYSNLQKEAEKTEASLNKLIERQEKFLESGGKTKSRTFRNMQYDIDQTEKQLAYLRGEIQDMEDSGTAYTAGGATEEAAKMAEKLAIEEKRLEEMNRSLITSSSQLKDKILQYGGTVGIVAKDFKSGLNELRVAWGDFFASLKPSNVFASIINGLKNVSINAKETAAGLAKTAWGNFVESAKPSNIFASLINKFKNLSASARNAAAQLAKLAGKGITGGLKKISSGIFGINKSSNKTTLSLGKMLKYALGIRSLYALFNRLRSSLVEGFKNLAQYSGNTNQVISRLKSSLTQLKNSLATAFDPILTAIAPALNYLIGLLNSATAAIAQFMAALTGQGTFIRAKKVQEDYAKSLSGTAGAAKEAEGALASFDKLNVQQDKSSGGGGAGGVSPSEMFETVPVESAFKDMADKARDILSQLFNPFKEAWEREGEFVMDSWKYALQEVWTLVKDIGRDFLIMWNEEETVQMFSDILHIVGDIGLITGNLAAGLDEAWNKNSIGLSILENIRDIFAIIVKHVRNIADYTVIWSKGLDFYPLLESINTLLEALEPLADTIGAGLEWFWINVLLPIAEWTIEDAVPAYLNMLSAEIKALDSVANAFKPVWQWFWDNFLEPLGEWTGELIISAMEKITDLLTRIGDWVSAHSEEVSQFATIVGGLAAAFVSVNGGIGLVIKVLPFLTGLIGEAVAVITGPVGIVAALTAMVVATGHGQEVIEALQRVLSGLIDFVAGVFTLDWERAWNGVLDIFGGLLDGIAGIAKSIIDTIGGIIDKIGEAIRGYDDLEKAGKMKHAGGTLVSGIVSNVPRAASEEIYLPRLASGTVVPPRVGEFAAILGDNKREAEVVSPISTMKQALKEALLEANITGSGDIVGYVYLDGKEMGQSTVKFVRQEKKRTGKNPVLV